MRRPPCVELEVTDCDLTRRRGQVRFCSIVLASHGDIEIRDGDAVRHTREDGHHRQLDITETRQASRLDAQTIHIRSRGRRGRDGRRRRSARHHADPRPVPQSVPPSPPPATSRSRPAWAGPTTTRPRTNRAASSSRRRACTCTSTPPPMRAPAKSAPANSACAKLSDAGRSDVSGTRNRRRSDAQHDGG